MRSNFRMIQFTAVLTCAIVTVAILTVSPNANAGGLACKIGTLVEQVMGDDTTALEKAVMELRILGQPALNALCDAYVSASGGQDKDSASDSGAKLERLRNSIDAVAKQRDAFKSRLFWHTELQSAIDEANRTHRPILSLRLLGKLDDELSCANSRYFRTVLYANATVSNYLRDHFVLHWQTVRPVPVITIDFGDGRKIERTITGNSIHYVLDSNGEIIDAIPGLYGPSAFLRTIQSAQSAFDSLTGLAISETRKQILHTYHMDALTKNDLAWTEDLNKAGVPASAGTHIQTNQALNQNPQPLAARAAPIAFSKMQVEAPMLTATLASPLKSAILDSPISDELWTRIASFHSEDAQLDQVSIELMRLKAAPARPIPAEVASKAAISKRRAEDPFMRVLRNFQQSIALDTVRNEYLLHRSIHEWLAEAAGTNVNKDQFNERVYAELFLTPLNDPWMGLVANDAYAALDQGGLLSACK